jgi:hypothetical protein
VTIAVSLKVNEGLVFAADSASTLLVGKGRSIGVHRVYNHANKITNLRKGSPIGFMSWDLGSIGPASISTLAKDLRRRLSGRDPAYPKWELDRQKYTIEEVAERTKTFFFTERYKPFYKGRGPKPGLGILVGGYSAGAELAEEYRIDIANGKCTGPDQLQTSYGVTWDGQRDALSRLILGISTRLPRVLIDRLGVPEAEVPPVLQVLREALQVELVAAYMPLQDAIDLATYLVEVSVGFTRFNPGPDTVGGPIEVAAISKHEGFKWIRRKHFFTSQLNPTTGADMSEEVMEMGPRLQDLVQHMQSVPAGGEKGK